VPGLKLRSLAGMSLPGALRAGLASSLQLAACGRGCRAACSLSMMHTLCLGGLLGFTELVTLAALGVLL
jgi:hypothetical protein